MHCVSYGSVQLYPFLLLDQSNGITDVSHFGARRGCTPSCTLAERVRLSGLRTARKMAEDEAVAETYDETEAAAGEEEVDEELETMKQRLKEMEDETNKLTQMNEDEASAKEAAANCEAALFPPRNPSPRKLARVPGAASVCASAPCARACKTSSACMVTMSRCSCSQPQTNGLCLSAG
jgi:hypothetical protein